MSISTPQNSGDRRSTPVARPAAGARRAVPSNRPGGTRASSGGSGRRPPVTQPQVASPRNWGPIILFGSVGLVAILIIGIMSYQVYQRGRSWQDKANAIPGIVDYYKTEPSLLKPAQHQFGPVKYPQTPPVGGPHNFNWQRCLGDVYPAQIANEHAVHSMEHGAVWITYDPAKLTSAQVDTLAKKVRGNDYMLMSPYPNQGSPISLQAWGYQLKVDSVTDPRIDQFIQDLRQNATREPGVLCSTGDYITATGTTPHDLGAPPSTAPSAGATGVPSAAATGAPNTPQPAGS